jgi:hypothetical protein
MQDRRLMKKQPKHFITDGLPTYSVTANEFSQTLNTFDTYDCKATTTTIKWSA